MNRPYWLPTEDSFSMREFNYCPRGSKCDVKGGFFNVFALIKVDF